MDDFNSETDSDYTSYWRDWVSTFSSWLSFRALFLAIQECSCGCWFYRSQLHWLALRSTGTLYQSGFKRLLTTGELPCASVA